jgi:hypothetical protein
MTALGLIYKTTNTVHRYDGVLGAGAGFLIMTDGLTHWSFRSLDG